MSDKEKIDTNKSSLKEAYLLLGTSSPHELYKKYLIEDQKIVTSKSSDYHDPKLITNKIKEVIEKADSKKLSKEERECRLDILWLWYHHAISYAIWGYKDKKCAEEYALQALKYQPKDNPNKITRLLYLLICDQLLDAEKWVKTINENPERTTALDLLKFYKDGGFFK